MNNGDMPAGTNAAPTQAIMDCANQGMGRSDAIPTYQAGLSKREHFAGLALQGLLANSDCTHLSVSSFAAEAVISADELLKELNK